MCGGPVGVMTRASTVDGVLYIIEGRRAGYIYFALPIWFSYSGYMHRGIFARWKI